ncbi:MAG TPA: hypothetical protein VMA32_13535 [Streptosporangiaceae bacterium]|nr:hypothetical protein [Streptosporangiaceae bacterium]
MGIAVSLYRNGQRVTALADPAGGHFDAAGDFDRLIPSFRNDLPLLSSVDPFGGVTVQQTSMQALIAEVNSLLRDARPGPEQRGLLRLRALAEACAALAGSELLFRGD